MKDVEKGVLCTLRREVEVRLLNCSPSGGLLETELRLEPGTVGMLSVVVDGTEVVDHVQVVRCQPIGGAGSRCHVGVRFLWLTSPAAGSIRRVFARASRGAITAD